jgi:major membrane immunogen (membrane-anchored lipoprotein)
MTVKDETGNIKLSAFNKLRKFQSELKKGMPALKDRVRVVGSLSISQSWGATMFLSVPSRVKVVQKYIIQDRPIGKITQKDEGELFRIEAEIFEYDQFTTQKGSVMHKFLLGDKTGEIPMVLYSNELENLPEDIKTSIVKKWNKFRFQVQISQFRGAVQAKIVNMNNPEHIKLISGNTKSSKKLKKKKIKNISKKDAGKTYLITAETGEVNLGKDGVFIELGGGKVRLFIKYSRWERMKETSLLSKGNKKITAPMRVEVSGGRILLSISDYQRLKVSSLPAKVKPKPMTIEKIIENERKAEESKKLVKKIDIAKLEKKHIGKITKKDVGKTFLVQAKVTSIDFGSEGAYLNLDKSDIEFCVSYSDQEKIMGFSKLNSGERLITAPVKIVLSNGKTGLKVVDFDGFKIQ